MNPRAILQDIQHTTAQGAAAISENAHLITAAAAFGIIAVDPGLCNEHRWVDYPSERYGGRAAPKRNRVREDCRLGGTRIFQLFECAAQCFRIRPYPTRRRREGAVSMISRPCRSDLD